VFGLVFSPLVLLGFAGLVMFQRDPLLMWLSGLCFGLAAGMWIVFRDSPPAYIENWNTGAEGERKTARELRRLDGSRWSVVHDVDNGHGNYDHILVSEAGVFLLDSKYLGGSVELRGDELWISRRHDPEADRPEPAARRSALRGAVNLSQTLHRLTGSRVWVQAVVVFWCDFDPGVHEDDRCAFVHGSSLRDWLESRPRRMAPVALERLTEAVSHLVAEAGSERPTVSAQGEAAA
jgi:Nuclease-related domain